MDAKVTAIQLLLQEKDPTSLLLDEYQRLLQDSCTQFLNPLQLSAFEIIVNNIADSLMSCRVASSPVTSLIDSISDIHLEYIENFQQELSMDSEDK